MAQEFARLCNLHSSPEFQGVRRILAALFLNTELHLAVSLIRPLWHFDPSFRDQRTA